MIPRLLRATTAGGGGGQGGHQPLDQPGPGDKPCPALGFLPPGRQVRLPCAVGPLWRAWLLPG
eukprot:258916-Alexandrium_andersonii.AAC.1